MTAVSNSPRWVLINAYFTLMLCDLRRLLIAPPLFERPPLKGVRETLGSPKLKQRYGRQRN